MSTEVMQVNKPNWEDPTMVRTLKDTVCKGATDSQFRMFVEICRLTGLNPLLREIWLVPSVGVMAGRDGYLRVANENAMFDGMETRVERDEKNVPIKAVCTVWRKDRSHPIIAEAYYSEYKKSSSVWQSYPSAMISKVSEVLALKRSFAINGVVTEEEIGDPAEPAEPKGSREAQVSMAEARIKQLSAPVIDAAPVPDAGYEERHAALVMEANEVLDQPAQAKAPAKKGSMSFEALKKWGELKKELRTLTGADTVYYAALKAKGYAHANEIQTAKEAAAIWKVLASEKTSIERDSEVRAVLSDAETKLGPAFIQILGRCGFTSIDDFMASATGEQFQDTLSVVKEEVDVFVAKLKGGN